MTVPSYGFSLTGIGTTAPVTSAGLGKALPIGRDLELDVDTHDLVLTGGDLQIVQDLEAIRQEIDIRLRFFLAEWFLDITQGVPYLQNILVKAPNLAAIRGIFNEQILLGAGIKSITKLDLDYDQSDRTLTVTWSATTDLGELIESEVTL
jgi:hypothetical protein